MLFTSQFSSKVIRPALILAAVCLLQPQLAHANSGAGIASLGLPAFNFAIYLILFVYIFRKHIAPKLKARSIDIREKVKLSGQTLRAVEGELSTMRERLSDIPTEREEMLKSYDQEADELARAIIAKAQENARSLSRDTARRVEQEFKQAANAVRAEAIALALERVRSELQASLTSEKDAELRRGALQTMVL